MKIQVFIEGQRLDLFKDEQVRVTQGVQNVKDISKLFADYSQSFTVPASSNNNAIFKHFYNASIDGGFDARTRKLATIDVNTLNFKRGKITLEDVKIKNGVPEFYRITFVGDVVKIKDLLGSDKLFDLDWLDNFDHDYSDTNVQTGLTTGIDFTVDGTLYEKAVIYPLISYKRQYYYNSDTSDTTATDVLSNIAYDVGRTDGVDFIDLKPAIKLSIIVQAIKEKYGLNFTGTFFDSQVYQDIYMNLNNTTTDISTGYILVDEVSGTLPNLPFWSYVKSNATITPLAGFESTPYELKITINGQVHYQTGAPITDVQTKSTGEVTSIPAGSDYEVKLEVFSNVDFEFDADFEFKYKIAVQSETVVFDNTYLNNIIDLQTSISRELKDIKVYDFLTSIFKMFNLVVTPDGEDLYVQDLQTWYTEGQIYDVTQFIDTTSETVKKGVIYNEIDFVFEESEQIIADVFYRNNNVWYGNIEQRLYADAAQTEPLNGDKLEIDVVFENPIYERITDLNTSFLTTIQYCPYFDRDLNTISGEPFLMYLPETSVASNTIGFKGSGTYTELSGNIYMPSHSMQIDTTSFNLNFNAEVNEYTGNVFTDTIYDRFYSDYISDIFSIKRRMYNFKAILPNNLLYNLKLNDRLVIKDRRFIINSITSNLTERGDTLELINDIYDAPLASDSLNTSLFRIDSGIYNALEHSDTINYVGLDNQTATLVDTGDGTSWVTLTNPKSVGVTSNIAFDMDANLTGLIRYMQIKIIDGIKNPVYTITQFATKIGALDFSNPDNAVLISNLIGIKQ